MSKLVCGVGFNDKTKPTWVDGVKMYMFDKNNEWLSFEQAFLKYSPITYTWCEFKEPTKSLHGEVNL